MDLCGQTIIQIVKKVNGLFAILNKFMIHPLPPNPIRTLFVICLWPLNEEKAFVFGGTSVYPLIGR